MKLTSPASSQEKPSYLLDRFDSADFNTEDLLNLNAAAVQIASTPEGLDTIEIPGLSVGLANVLPFYIKQHEGSELPVGAVEVDGTLRCIDTVLVSKRDSHISQLGTRYDPASEKIISIFIRQPAGEFEAAEEKEVKTSRARTELRKFGLGILGGVAMINMANVVVKVMAVPDSPAAERPAETKSEALRSLDEITLAITLGGLPTGVLIAGTANRQIRRAGIKREAGEQANIEALDDALRHQNIVV